MGRPRKNLRGAGRRPIEDPMERTVSIAIRIKQKLLDELLPYYEGKITPMILDAVLLLREKKNQKKSEEVVQEK